MCRIFFSPSNITFRSDHLTEFFCHLEKLQGKDGNGVYVFKTKQLIKSVDIMPDAKKVEEKFMFHTRFATHGAKKDWNCQPFVGDKYIVVHNGVCTDAYSHAKLLGFHGSKTKYSDSYAMHYIIEKVGILNFYLGFTNNYYGVVLVYDKENKKTYLLKSGGQFEYGILRGGKYIYGSAETDFWKLKNPPIPITSGMYILEDDGYICIHKDYPIATSTYSSRGWDGSYGYGYDSRTRSSRTHTSKWDKKNIRAQIHKANKNKVKNCQWCFEVFTKGQKKYKDHGYIICRTCWMTYGDREISDEADASDESIRGINNLFPDNENPRPMICRDCSRKLVSTYYILSNSQRLCLDCYKIMKDKEDKTVITAICEISNCTDCGRRIKKKSGDYIKGSHSVGNDVLCPKCYKKYEGKSEITPNFCKDCGWLKRDECHYEDTKRNGFYFSTNKLLCHTQNNDGVIRKTYFRIPAKCTGCNWLKDGRCWYGGEKSSFVSMIEDKTGYSICHSKYGSLHVDMYCKSCGDKIGKTDEWALYGGNIVVCLECHNAMYNLETASHPIPERCEVCSIPFEGDMEIVEIDGEIMCQDCSDFIYPQEDDYIKYLGKYRDNYEYDTGD